MLENLDEFLYSNSIFYETNVPLKGKTWIKRGGIAKYFIIPNNLEALKATCLFLYQHQLPFELIGHTSNLYILNDYNPLIVISTKSCNKIEYLEESIVCECGTSVAQLARLCVNKGICGFEYLTDLPGTIGGAIYNNSSCKDNSISKLLLKIDFLDSQGKLYEISTDDLDFSFRESSLKRKSFNGIILRAYLRKEKGNTSALQKIARLNHQERLETLETNHLNLGCTFNKPFSNGRMPFIYRLPLFIFNCLLYLFVFKKKQHRRLSIRFILFLTGYRCLIPYVSDKLILTFIWKDEEADKLFPYYVEFMKKIYKTDSLEIEIKKNYGKD